MTADASQVYALAADLDAAGDEVEKRARRVVTRTAFSVQGMAQGLAPVDTGFLRSSISIDLRVLEAEIGPTANYGLYVEMGTSRMSPQPFMYPAAEAHEDEFLAKLAEAAGDAL